MMARSHGRARLPAFTLTEVVAALVILAVGVPPALWALRESGRRRALPVQATTARWLAAEKLEQILADRCSPSLGYDTLVDANYPDEPAVAASPSFARFVEFADVGPDLASPGAGCRIATVRVEWTDALGHSRSLALSAVFAEHAP